MGVSNLFSSRHNQPNQVGTTPTARSYSSLSSGKKLSGAFIFLAFMAVVIYGIAPAENAGTSGTSKSSAATQIQLHANQDASGSLQQPNTAPSQPTEPETTTNTDEGLSTNVTTTNGVTEVTVNGETVKPNEDGSVTKTINNDNGSVQLHVSQKNNPDSNSSSSSSEENMNSSN